MAILVITFYLTISKNGFRQFLEFIVPSKYHTNLLRMFSMSQKKVGLWFRGQLLLCSIIGILSFIGLLILGVQYALVLGLIAGISEIIPFVGPILGAIPAVVLAFIQSPIKALLVIILYIVIQQFENHIIVPNLMNRVIGLNPIVVIVTILIGGKLAGIIGAIVAVPVATVIVMLAKDFFQSTQKKEEVEDKREPG